MNGRTAVTDEVSSDSEIGRAAVEILRPECPSSRVAEEAEHGLRGVTRVINRISPKAPVLGSVIKAQIDSAFAQNCRRLTALSAAAIFWVPAAIALAPDSSIDVNATLTHYRCYTCHSERDSLAGPAFADIAKRYRGRKDAVSHIARQIATGVRTGGPWHMPPHPEVSRDEARAMARYIMSLGDKGVHPPGDR